MRCRLPLLLIIATFGLCSCESEQEKEERLAKQYCGSCHLFPDPDLLDKQTWKNSVLPEMAFRMGLSSDNLRNVLAEDIPIVLTAIPSSPMVTDEEWKSITNYFVRNAPDSLDATEIRVADSVQQFNVHKVETFKKGFITLLKFDSINDKLYVGNRRAELYVLNKNLVAVDSVQLSSAPSHISSGEGNILISLMGIMDPNDQAKGKLSGMKSDLKNSYELIDSLQRPVYFERSDLNKDGLNDFIVCSFGNFTGALLAFEGTSEKTFIKHVIDPMPGARKAVVQDFNHDGLNDILALMAQGDERLILYTNRGNFQFDMKILLRFPPVYGSNYFEINDFNKDGFFDILFTNGDNADFSSILKPYHAVRIFANDGKNNFTESWSFAMPGAFQTASRDFDGDGDPDIAAISFFPDPSHPEQGFIYFENTGDNHFKPYTTSAAANGRWLVMESADVDGDGDIDVLLGSANFMGMGTIKSNSKNLQLDVALLFLENKLAQKNKVIH